MTLEEFKKIVKKDVQQKGTSFGGDAAEAEDFRKLLLAAPMDSELWQDYTNKIYSPLIDKEVERIWLKRNSKLAKVLR